MAQSVFPVVVRERWEHTMAGQPIAEITDQEWGELVEAVDTCLRRGTIQRRQAGGELMPACRVIRIDPA